MYNPRFVSFLLQMNTNTCDRSMLVLHPASAVVTSVVSLCLICTLIKKSIKLTFSWNTLLSVSCGNPRSKTPHAFVIPIVSIPPCLRISSSKNPPLPSEFRKARPWYVWIFSGIAHSRPWCSGTKC